MMRYKVVLLFAVMFLLVSAGMTANAQVEEETGSQGGGALSGFLKILGDAAQDVLEEEVQEEIDDWAGTYKGRIGEVVLVERRGNAVTFEVKYEGVKRSDGVYVTGEVLKWGEAQEGFNTTVSPVNEKNGSVRLTIGHENQDDSGWGLPSEETTDTDQIRLSLVRETNPEKPFGELVYDFPKSWTDSSDIETLPEETVAAEEAGEGAIELAEGETSESTADASASKPAITLMKPGFVMIPSNTSANQSSAAAADSSTSDAVRTRRRDHTVSEYNFFDNARRAKWTNGSKELTFPGSRGDNSGYALSIDEGYICPGNKANNLLMMYPELKKGGKIEGRYPLMVLGSNVKFKATGALLKGAESSDGVIMSVLVDCENKRYSVFRGKITSKNYTAIEADMSKWAGKEVRIVLNVNAGDTGKMDQAVWVHPRLTAN